jgi:hypothetical protein
MSLTDVITEATRRATAKNVRARQKQISVPQARNFTRELLTLLAGLPTGEVGAILARYTPKR